MEALIALHSKQWGTLITASAILNRPEEVEARKGEAGLGWGGVGEALIELESSVSRATPGGRRTQSI